MPQIVEIIEGSSVVRDMTDEEVSAWEADQEWIAENNIPLPYRIGKSTPWRRMTDTEAVAVSTAIKQQSIREQMIYDAASYIDSGDPLFDTLKQVLVALFGEKRADELLAPETLE